MGHAKGSLKSIPSAVYTMPEVASVGLSEEVARQKYDNKIGKFSFAGNGRALESWKSS